jgi:hypothetical protein
MSDKQPSKRRKTEKSSASRRMEDDLNKSSFRPSGAVGRPHHDVPYSSAADPYEPPSSNETGRVAPTARPLASNETGQGAPIVRPLVSNETGQVAPTRIPPQEGNAAPVADAPTGPLYDGSHAGMRGVDPAGYEHGANYGGYLATRFNSSMVDDGEAASRAEYRYQQVQRQASRTPAYGDPYGCPRPNARSDSLRTSFDGRERESQSSRALDRIEGIMTRMERHFAASTSAPATSSATHSAPFYQGEFQSFYFELLKFASIFRFFTFRDFYPRISLPALIRVRSVM